MRSPPRRWRARSRAISGSSSSFPPGFSSRSAGSVGPPHACVKFADDQHTHNFRMTTLLRARGDDAKHRQGLLTLLRRNLDFMAGGACSMSPKQLNSVVTILAALVLCPALAEPPARSDHAPIGTTVLPGDALPGESAMPAAPHTRVAKELSAQRGSADGRFDPALSID